MKTKKFQNEKLEAFVKDFESKYQTRQEVMNLEFQLGIDQAGRGPVMGPMVYSALWWPKQFKQIFAELGFDDSKVLKEQDREFLFQRIKKMKNIFFFQVEILHADLLSKKQQKFDATNLNTISHNAAIKLLRSALSQGFKITDVYVDTVGDPGKYKDYILSRITQFKHIVENVTVQSKADRDHKVVSASSICAKVTRDTIIQNWKFIQNIDVHDELGSGYPSDPKTKAWLVKYRHKVFGYPNLIRFSWQTCTNALQNFCILKINDQKDQEKHKALHGLRKKVIDLFEIVQ